MNSATSGSVIRERAVLTTRMEAANLPSPSYSSLRSMTDPRRCPP